MKEELIRKIKEFPEVLFLKRKEGGSLFLTEIEKGLGKYILLRVGSGESLLRDTPLRRFIVVGMIESLDKILHADCLQRFLNFLLFSLQEKNWTWNREYHYNPKFLGPKRIEVFLHGNEPLLSGICEGGGIIEINPQEKTIILGSESSNYGREDRDYTTKVFQKIFPDFRCP